MTNRTQFKLLFAIMATATLIVTAVSILSLYEVAITQHRLRLVETVKSQARFIEAIAKYDQASYGYGSDPAIWQKESLRKIHDAHSQFGGFGETGEFTLARKQGNEIVFELRHRHYDLDKPKPIPFAGQWAEATRLALSNQSGTLIGPDYRGKQVLAAYEPVKFLNLALVAKIDLSEIRKPFVNAGLIALAVASIVLLIASQLFFHITRPIVENIERQAETFLTLVRTIKEGVFLIDEKGIIQFVNPAGEMLFGYKENQLMGCNISQLMPSPHREAHDSYIQNYLDTGIRKIIGTGRQLTALRKDGTVFPIYLSIGDINLKHTRLFTGIVVDITDQQELQREIMELPVREQRRIGQELHDGLGQQLTGLSMLATSLVNKASKTDHKLATQLAKGLKESISQVRALSHGLMPVEINSKGFVAALEFLIKEMTQQSNIPISLKLDASISYSDDRLVSNLYRIAQEALHNAIKHAHAETISVSLQRQNHDGLLEIFDDGCGISSEPNHGRGLGLRIMKYRSGLFNAEFTVRNNGNRGTTVTCRFPLTVIPKTT